MGNSVTRVAVKTDEERRVVTLVGGAAACTT